MSWEDILKLAVVIAIIESALIIYKRLVPKEYKVETWEKMFDIALKVAKERERLRRGSE